MRICDWCGVQFSNEFFIHACKISQSNLVLLDEEKKIKFCRQYKRQKTENKTKECKRMQKDVSSWKIIIKLDNDCFSHSVRAYIFKFMMITLDTLTIEYNNRNALESIKMAINYFPPCRNERYWTRHSLMASVGIACRFWHTFWPLKF